MAELNITWVGSPNYWSGRTETIDVIVLHWMDGNLASADRTFQRNVGTDAATSAHYGIEDSTVHQYVRDEDTAWHARQANPFSIGIEHSAQPGRDASAETLETSAQLIASLAKKHSLTISEDTVKPHSFYVNTQCPGTLPVKDIIKRAQELFGDAPTVAVVDKPKQPQPVANKNTGGSLSLPADAKSWRVYNADGPYTVGHEVGILNPSLFGGLTYDILGNPTANVYIIQTHDFGRVAIYAGAETGATLAVTNQGITMGSGGGETVYLPASAASWRVYPTNKQPVIGNEVGTLNPSLFGGLAYAVLAEPQPDVVTVQTQDFGRVNLYVGPETGAIIK